MEKRKLKNNELPPLGVPVKATCVFSRDWQKILGGTKNYEKICFIKRIKSKDNSQGWQWSSSEIDTYFTGDVIFWENI